VFVFAAGVLTIGGGIFLVRQVSGGSDPSSNLVATLIEPIESPTAMARPATGTGFDPAPVEVPTLEPTVAPTEEPTSTPVPAPTSTPRPPTPRPAAIAPTSPPPPPPTAAAPPQAPVSLGAMEQDMFAAHNAERARTGAGPLTVDATLQQAAQRRAQDMASRNYFSRTSPSGETAFSILGQLGYSYSIAGENIARNNYPDNQSVSTAMTGFMNSPSHRDNLLDRRFNRVGIAMAIGADGMKYFAVVFAGR
jgi:uncharacterized protein YkwD